jgi:hypothetical protein
MIRRIVVLGLVTSLGAAALATESPATAQGNTPAIPFEAELVRALGFRTAPGLNAPHVIPTRNYLQPPSRVKITGSTKPLGTADAFCEAEYAGKKGYIRCDDMAAFRVVPAATPSSGGNGQWPSRNKFGVSCGNDMASCKAFCSKYCDTSADGSVTCTRIPQTGDGLLPGSSPLLQPLPKLKYVKTDSSDKATQETIDGLKRLDAWLATSADRAKYKYSMKVTNCWRDGDDDNRKECWFILKRNKDPRDLQLAMPGASAHSGGRGCDIFLLDENGTVANHECEAGADQQHRGRPAPQLRSLALRVGHPLVLPLQGPRLRQQVLAPALRQGQERLRREELKSAHLGGGCAQRPLRQR